MSTVVWVSRTHTLIRNNKTLIFEPPLGIQNSFLDEAPAYFTNVGKKYINIGLKSLTVKLAAFAW
jgi:hypothetical protein